MSSFVQDFTNRQYMVTPDFEYFHYKDESTTEVDYHNHDFYEIYCFISGKVTYVTEGKSYRLNPGDIILIDNKDLHKPIVEPGETYERVVIWVNPDFLAQESTQKSDLTMCFESSSLKKNNLLGPSLEMNNIIWDILRKFEKCCHSISFGSNILKKLYLIELIVYLNKAFFESYNETPDINVEYNEKVNSIIRYINDNLEKDLSLDHISEHFYLSKYHLLRLFKKYTGFTLHKYIHQKRLIMAKSLLRQGSQVTEVYSKCGFGDYSNFIRSFKGAFGVSPKKYFKNKI